MQAILLSSDGTNACYYLSALNPGPPYSLVTLGTSNWNTGSSSWFSNLAVDISTDSPNI